MKQLQNKILAILLVLTLCFAAVACNVPTGNTGTGNTDGTGSTGDSNDNTQGGDAAKEATTYVGIDINPSVELTVSEDGVVVSVFGANEDGKILLYEQEASIVGLDIEAAVARVTELAVELDYLNEENADFKTTVVGGESIDVAALKEKIDSKITASAEGLGLTVSASVEDAFALLCELNELKAQYPDNEAIQSLTPDKFRLVTSATEGGEVTVEAAVEMSDAELIAEINRAHATVEAYATDAYLAAKARANAMFESSMGVLSDGIYTMIYAERAPFIMTNLAYLNTLHYGATYQAYKTSARTYLAVLEIMSFADEYTDFVLDEQTVSDLAAALGINDTTALEDADGNITLGSVMDYCDRFIKENEVSDEVKGSVEEILAKARDAAELVTISSEAYASELALLKSSIETVIEAVSTASSTILPFLPEDAKAEFEACLADLQATGEELSRIIDEGDTSDAVRALAAEAQAKADDMKTKIDADLSDAEKQRAEELEAAIESQIEALVAQFNDRLATAEESAKQYLSEQRAARMQKAEE